MFAGCESLKKLDVSNFNTENVTNMTRTFANCYSLNELDLSNFKTDKVEKMSGMFYNCKSLTKLDISNFNFDNVKDLQTNPFGAELNNDMLVLVKDEKTKQTVLKLRSEFTNVQIKTV